MPEHLRALVVVLGLAGMVFLAARGPACQAAMAPGDFQRRRNLWLVLTLLLFLAHDFWLFIAASALVLVVSGRRDPNPTALFLFLLFAAPALASDISGFGLARQLFVISHPRLLALTILLPAALVLLAGPGKASPGSKWPDGLLAGYLVLTLVLQLDVDSVTNTLRFGFYYVLDVILPYYVASRGLRRMEDFRDALMSFAVAAMVLGATGAFESAKGWLLYGSLEDVLGVNWGYGEYLQRGESLRALATTGQPIAMGFVMAVATGLFLFLRSAVPSRPAWRLGLALLFAGLLAPLSRGPWLGAGLGFIVFIASGPRPLESLSKLALIGLIAGPIVLATPLGEVIIERLPFMSTEASDTVIYRQELLETSLGIIKDNPFFGSYDFLMRMEGLRQGQGIIDVVNTYLGVALTSGLTGLTLFVSFFLAIILGIGRALWAGSAMDDDLVLLGRALLATLAGIMAIIFTVSSITVIPTVYWSVAGIGLAYIRLLEKRRLPGGSPVSAPPPRMAGLKA